MIDKEVKNNGRILDNIGEKTDAYLFQPDDGFSLFLAKRTKTIHFIRHAEGTHNAANRVHGDDTPVTFSTEGSWKYIDARLTDNGIQQCVEARTTLLHDVHPQLIVVSPFSRTLQTAHIMFAGKGIPFVVHDLCRERSGFFTCDKRRSKTEIIADFAPIYEHTNDQIDFESFGYCTEDDMNWNENREPSDILTQRGVNLMKWLATRPEKELAVVTHSSWLKHLFWSFGDQVDSRDQKVLHRLAGNAEIRSVCLALHKGFYPEGTWDGDTFIPCHKSFRRYHYAPSNDEISLLHANVRIRSEAGN